MKKFSLFVLGIALGAVAMYFYCSNSETDFESAPPVVAPKGIITPSAAKTLDTAYDIKHQIINDSLFKKSTDGGDNRSSWWSLEDVQNYINYAEHQSGELGYTMDGLRVYLGSYPNANNGEAGLTTMFMVPTGVKNVAKGSAFSFQGGNIDIKDADVLNRSEHGNPPSANYPQ
ncbi:hypothetical protein [Winogradskyella vidalii]|uniref:hypothetical protein n=1 Tax=Winogradskyella vidalii TaxID=2615024 RepID=UPI0015CD0739|nr:hypothetical protein [Winogradskyella vidalii]